MADVMKALLAVSLFLVACAEGAADRTTLALEETITTTSSRTSTTSISSTTTTALTTTTTRPTTTTTDPGSQYIGTTYSDASEIDLHFWGGWHIAGIGPGPTGWDSPFWGSRWESGGDQMLWFERETGNGSEVVVLDVVSFPVPGPGEAVADSGCIAADDGVDAELHGVARHEGGNRWTVLRLWRADRDAGQWFEIDPAGHVVEPATGSCELGAGDGPLP